MWKGSAAEHLSFVCEFNNEGFCLHIKYTSYALISSDMCTHTYLCARVYANTYSYTYFILYQFLMYNLFSKQMVAQKNTAGCVGYILYLSVDTK